MRSGRSSKNAAELDVDLGLPIGLGDAVEVLGAALLRDPQRDAAARRGSSAIAGGTRSAKARAPWLPPNTSSRIGPPSSRSG